MPIIHKKGFMCEHCDVMYIRFKTVIKHERGCKYNKINKSCYTCEHLVRLKNNCAIKRIEPVGSIKWMYLRDKMHNVDKRYCKYWSDKDLVEIPF